MVSNSPLDTIEGKLEDELKKNKIDEVKPLCNGDTKEEEKDSSEKNGLEEIMNQPQGRRSTRRRTQPGRYIAEHTEVSFIIFRKLQ